MRREPISTSSEWTFELIQEYDCEIAKIAQEYGLDTYPNQIEIISSEQMMDACLTWYAYWLPSLVLRQTFSVY